MIMTANACRLADEKKPINDANDQWLNDKLIKCGSIHLFCEWECVLNENEIKSSRKYFCVTAWKFHLEFQFVQIYFQKHSINSRQNIEHFWLEC